MPGGTGFESSRRLLKWLILGTAIGCVAGLGAVVFYGAIEFATRTLLGSIAGYHPPGPAGEGAASVTPIARAWLLPVVTTLGGLVSGLLVLAFAPEAEGHGTDAAIDAIHRRGGWIRGRVVPVKLLASAITIGTGGSAGREGPAAQISAGFASVLGRRILSRAEDRRIAVAAGIGAGIGAIFRAPLGGAVLAAEILYLHDIEVEAIIPSLIASIVGYTIYGVWFGFGPIFGAHAALQLGPPIQLVYYAILGVVCGVGGALYSRIFYQVSSWFAAARLPPWAKPALGGLAVGSIGMFLPHVLHTGYGWVQIAMTKDGLLSFAPSVLVAIIIGKILATSLSIGSGGAGGIFGPGMVIGGMLGALLWRVSFGVLPSVPADPAAFVIIGMMALFGSIAHAPLAVMLMVAEMTGTLSLLAPAMIAVAVATAVVGDETIYRAQLRDRASSPAHRARFSLPVLAMLQVREAAEPIRVAVRDDEEASSTRDKLIAAVAAAALVCDEDLHPIGAVTREAVERLAESDPHGHVGDLASLVTLDVNESLEHAMGQLAEAGESVALAVDEGRPGGLITLTSTLRAYRAAREAQGPTENMRPDTGRAANRMTQRGVGAGAPSA